MIIHLKGSKLAIFKQETASFIEEEIKRLFVLFLYYWDFNFSRILTMTYIGTTLTVNTIKIEKCKGVITIVSEWYGCSKPIHNRSSLLWRRQLILDFLIALILTIILFRIGFWKKILYPTIETEWLCSLST